MENSKHIGAICALAVALGVGMAAADTSGVASAKPDDPGHGSSGDSSPARSSGHRSASSDGASATHGSSPTGDTPRHRRLPDLPDVVSRHADVHSGAATPNTSDTDKRRNGRPRAAAVDPPTTAPEPLAVDTSVAGRTVRDRGSDPAPLKAAGMTPSASTTRSAATRPAAALDPAPVTSPVTAPALSRPAAMRIAPTLAAPVTRMVSRLFDAVVGHSGGTVPTAPADSPAVWALLAFARREFEQAVADLTTMPPTATADPGFISSHHDFGLFSTTSAADPDDDDFVAFVLETPFFTDIVTSGADPEDNLGFGAASTGVPGQTVNTFTSPFGDVKIALPITDPVAGLYTALVRLGL